MEFTSCSKALRGEDPSYKVDLFQSVLKRKRSIIFQVFVRCSIILLSDNFLKHCTLLLFIDFRSSFVTDGSDSIIIKNI